MDDESNVIFNQSGVSVQFYSGDVFRDDPSYSLFVEDADGFETWVETTKDRRFIVQLAVRLAEVLEKRGVPNKAQPRYTIDKDKYENPFMGFLKELKKESLIKDEDENPLMDHPVGCKCVYDLDKDENLFREDFDQIKKHILEDRPLHERPFLVSVRRVGLDIRGEVVSMTDTTAQCIWFGLFINDHNGLPALIKVYPSQEEAMYVGKKVSALAETAE